VNFTTFVRPAVQLRWTSASRSHVGCVRERNEDACLDQPARGLWAVADGMGGHAMGDFASRTTVQQLAAVTRAAGLPEFLAVARMQLLEANRRLRMEAARQHVQVIGSTVVALFAGEDRCACLWAGDSRLYLHRKGRLALLTRDHSQSGELLQRTGHFVTRAVGAADALDLDETVIHVEDGDMFLLCSDGLTNEVDEDEIALTLAGGDCRRAADMLVDLALAHGGRDNVSVVVVRADDMESADRTAWNPAI
jgi:protein phosphatase